VTISSEPQADRRSSHREFLITHRFLTSACHNAPRRVIGAGRPMGSIPVTFVQQSPARPNDTIRGSYGGADRGPLRRLR
jgi:hypothetical protein